MRRLLSHVRREAAEQRVAALTRHVLRAEAEEVRHGTERAAALAVLRDRVERQDGADAALAAFVSAHHGAEHAVVESDEEETEREVAALMARQQVPRLPGRRYMGGVDIPSLAFKIWGLGFGIEGRRLTGLQQNMDREL